MVLYPWEKKPCGAGEPRLRCHPISMLMFGGSEYSSRGEWMDLPDAEKLRSVWVLSANGVSLHALNQVIAPSFGCIIYVYIYNTHTYMYIYIHMHSVVRLWSVLYIYKCEYRICWPMILHNLHTLGLRWLLAFPAAFPAGWFFSKTWCCLSVGNTNTRYRYST